MTTAFSYSSPKIPKSGIFGLKFRLFCFFREILQLDKFEGADFKYYHNMFKFESQNTQTWHF